MPSSPPPAPPHLHGARVGKVRGGGPLGATDVLVHHGGSTAVRFVATEIE